MNPYLPEAPKSWRAERALARRRRRRRRRGVGALVLLALAGALVWAVHPGTRNRGSRDVHRSIASAGLPIGARRAGVHTAPGATPAPTAAELAAVRRLAALGRPLYCGGRGPRMVALTFDDGPGPYTKLAVKKLNQHHLQATFFLVGKEIPVWPGRVNLEKPVAAFGDHTMTHPFLPALAPVAIAQQIAGARAVIERATGEPVALFRPPYEGRSPAVEREVRSLGLLEVLWNVDSQDSLGANYARIERNVIAGLAPGSIILMHENHGQTIRALPRIFAALERDHLRAVTVPELVAEDPPTLAQLRAGIGGCYLSRRAGNGG